MHNHSHRNGRENPNAYGTSDDVIINENGVEREASTPEG